MTYLTEFLGLMAVFSLIIIAPGADFALVIRQCVVHGRKTALVTSFGIGISLLFHISYTILGIGLVVSNSLLLFSMIKWAGAAYLIWLGIKSWREPAYELQETDSTQSAETLSAPKAFAMGFITNALNPKPVLFFLSLFSALVSPHTPAFIQFSYGLGMATALIIWFVAVSYFFTSKPVREKFLKYSRTFNRARRRPMTEQLARRCCSYYGYLRNSDSIRYRRRHRIDHTMRRATRYLSTQHRKENLCSRPYPASNPSKRSATTRAATASRTSASAATSPPSCTGTAKPHGRNTPPTKPTRSAT